jgi:hypothetical protein
VSDEERSNGRRAFDLGDLVPDEPLAVRVNGRELTAYRLSDGMPMHLYARVMQLDRAIERTTVEREDGTTDEVVVDWGRFREAYNTIATVLVEGLTWEEANHIHEDRFAQLLAFLGIGEPSAGPPGETPRGKAGRTSTGGKPSPASTTTTRG